MFNNQNINVNSELYVGLVFDHYVEGECTYTHQAVRKPLLQPTVQTFNSCTSRPDVCQCLVVRTPMYNTSRNTSNTLMKHVACKSKLGSVVRSYIRPCQGKLEDLSVERSWILPGLPTHLVWKLKVGTVAVAAASCLVQV